MAFLNKRNLDIYDKRKEGWTYGMLAGKFGLSRERIRQICAKAGRIEESLGKEYLDAIKNGTPKPIRIDRPMLLSPLEYVQGLFPDVHHNLIVRAINCVGRKFVNEYPGMYKDYRIFLKALDTMSLEEVMLMRNCGAKTTELLLMVRTKIREVSNHGDQGSAVQ